MRSTNTHTSASNDHLVGPSPSCSLCIQCHLSGSNEYMLILYKPALMFQRNELDGGLTYLCVCTLAYTLYLSKTYLPFSEHELGYYFSSSPQSLSGVQSSQPWWSETPKFPLLPCRGLSQGRASTEAAAAEGPDSDAGCSRELCQGNHGVLFQTGFGAWCLCRN